MMLLMFTRTAELVLIAILLQLKYVLSPANALSSWFMLLFRTMLGERSLKCKCIAVVVIETKAAIRQKVLANYSVNNTH